MRVSEIRSTEGLTGLSSAWDDLLQRAPSATIYQTWEWHDAWWRAFGRRKSLRVLLAHDGDTLVGIAPLYVSRHLGTPLRRMAFIGTGASDYLDLILDQERADAASQALMDYLASAAGYDLADLQQVPEWSSMASPAAGDPVSGVVRRDMEVCPYAALPADWDTFARSLSKRFRTNIGYYERLLRKSVGQVEFELADAAGLDGAMTALFDLHGRRWRSRMLPGVLRGTGTRRFHRDVARRFLERGWLRLHVLRVDGRIVAALYCFSYRRRYYYYLGGFEPDLGRYSIGTTLTAAAIRTAIAEGCTEFDFLRGSEAYKYRWMPRERTNIEVMLPAATGWRSSAMLRLNGFERWVEHRAKAYSDRGKAAKLQGGTCARQEMKGAQTP